MTIKNPSTFVRLQILTLVCGFSALSARGAQLYVDVNSTNAIAPYTNWATAAIIIQDAVDAASGGDTVYVASGVYSNGFGDNAPVAGNSNRVSITKPIQVSSTDGPETTIIQGSGPVGTNGVRCVYLTNGATLSGFTLRGGAAYHFEMTLGGGGAFVEGGGALEDCTVTGCSASGGYGGGVYVRSNGLIAACTIVSNLASYGGGAYLVGADARIQNSTISTNGNNSTSAGGGVYVHQTGLLDGSTIESNNGGNGGGVYLRQGGSVSNCVIRFNRCRADGGGIQCYEGGLVDRCTVAGNTATVTGVGHGGGVDLISGGLLRNSLVFSNTATYYGGGVRMIYGGTVESCTIVGNSSTNLSGAEGGGLACWWSGTDERMRIRNSIIWGNTSASGEPNWDVYGGSFPPVFEYCCTTPTNGLPGGVGCFDADPLFEDPPASDYRLLPASPCRNTGTNQTWMIGARDLPGRTRIIGDIVDLGAYEVGTSVLHVWTNSPAPSWPYGSWNTAAHVIQDAVDEAVQGDLVLVTNGVYDTGGRPAAGALLTNRIVVDKAINLESVNGAGHTFIVGQGVGPYGTNNGDAAVRCLYLTNKNISVCGFTLTNGHTLVGAYIHEECQGGGIYSLAGRDVVSNCVVVGCSAVLGGGAFGAQLFNSLFWGNQADYSGGGAAFSLLNGCELRANAAVERGGGAFEGGAYNCLVISNVVSGESGEGGGLWAPKRNVTLNSLIVSNSAAFGGGIVGGAIYHCTVFGNTASQSGGGVKLGTPGAVRNSIVYGNSAPTHANWDFSGFDIEYSNNYSHCCTWPVPTNGVGYISNAPAFINEVAGDFRLRYGSPCIEAGTNITFDPSSDLSRLTNDLAGILRPQDGNFDGAAVPDIGAYEYNPAAYDSDGDGIPDGWEHGYGLNPTNALDAAENPDADPHNNLAEYLADTNPTNNLSFLRIVALSNLPPWTVYFWPSSTNRFYTLESSTNLAEAAWSNVTDQVRVPGTGETQSMSDTNTTAVHFYRVEAGP